MAKLCILVYWLVPEAEKQANQGLEREIREELGKLTPPLPYLKRIEKVTVLGEVKCPS